MDNKGISVEQTEVFTRSEDEDKDDSAREKQTRKKGLRTEQLHIRLTPQIKKKLSSMARRQGKNINDLCNDIFRFFDNEELLKSNDEAYKKIIFLYSNMANNINQLTRKCNASKLAATPEDLCFVLKEARNMANELLEKEL